MNEKEERGQMYSNVTEIEGLKQLMEMEKMGNKLALDFVSHNGRRDYG